VRALDIKLLRDFRRLWAQGIAIALVLACGVAVILMSVGMGGALDGTRTAYYERNRFADVFADARRAPLSLLTEIRAIPGVWAAEARIDSYAVLDLPGRVRVATGRILSLPADGAVPLLNVPILRSGDWPDPASDGQVVVNEPFARENGFRVGDSFTANLNGRKRVLTITGTALSPEFIYTIGPGQLMPDNASFGIVWMPERAASAAFDMTGAFTSVSLKLEPGQSAEPVIDALDALLGRYGGTGAHGRDDQMSDAFIDTEIQQLRTIARVMPPVFLGITVFLVNMVIGRIVLLERAEIGLLKAIGYSSARIALHYVLLAGLVALLGVAIGWLAGTWLSRAMARLYAQYFEFPFLIFTLTGTTYAMSAALGIGASVLGALRSALGAARLAPAVAMTPPPPPRFRRGVQDRLFQFLRLSQPTMMILRAILRWPVRSALTTLGIALATSILVASMFFDDSLDKIIDSAFHQSNRQDAMLLFAETVGEGALEDVARLPGVLQTEGHVYIASRIRHGHTMRQTPIEARRPGTDLSRVVDAEGRVVESPRGGILLSERLAATLGVVPGDLVEVEFLQIRRETHMIPVAGTVEQFFGLGAYMDLESLFALLRRTPQLTTANLLLDPAETEAFHAAVKDVPNLAGTILMTENLQSFQDTIAENVLVVTFVYALLGVVITVGVTYNGARIQLSERARELASLRILGFSRSEVSYVLMGETLFLALLAQPLGWWLGYLIARLMTDSFASDLYAVPLVLNPPTFAFASLVTLLAALGAALVVRRRVDTLDLVAVLKTRE
jgi:putative ABC transport system permease protein